MDRNWQAMNSPDLHFARSTTCKHARFDYIPEHVVCHIVSGEMRVMESHRESIYRAGDSFLLRRNALVKCEQRPLASGVAFRVIYLLLKKDFLQRQAMQHQSPKERPGTTSTGQVLLLEPTPSLTGLFRSLVAYMDAGTHPSAAMTRHKLVEMLICLLEQHPEMATWLFTETQAGKLDLAEFMERNFRFNVPMSKFAELSGRSLSTFQRDFMKIFGMQAGAWLLKRRLQAAREILLNSERKPSDVYIEIGFEDLAHFSRSFKTYFGYNPSKIKRTLEMD
ncbi:helix-turn-helix domain-containing protein [Mucilaginibacter sp. McL0603]|uniref:helix-turn-helix domain-containing protein n=1 Tax=Mucilaginibacter sp. McL0603 TaxID=3415670 RepID=UPI003CEA7149